MLNVMVNMAHILGAVLDDSHFCFAILKRGKVGYLWGCVKKTLEI